MNSMMQEDPLVVGGVDSHADTHSAAALNDPGVLLGTQSFPTTRSGYRQLLEWLGEFGEIQAVAVESPGSYAAALVRFLREHDVAIPEVNQPHAHSRRRVGKSDPVDAEMAARLFLAGKVNRPGVVGDFWPWKRGRSYADRSWSWEASEPAVFG